MRDNTTPRDHHRRSQPGRPKIPGSVSQRTACAVMRGPAQRTPRSARWVNSAIVGTVGRVSEGGRAWRYRAGRRLRSRTWCAVVIVMGLTATLLAIDLASSLVYRTNHSATLSVLPGDAEHPSFVVVVFPGFAMSGELAAKGLVDHLPSRTVVLGVSYAERGMDLDAISRAVLEELERLRPSRVFFYGASMGGLVASYVSHMYSLARAGSGISLILDTAPAGPQDVRRPQVLLAASCYYPGGIISSWLWSLAARAAPHVPSNGAGASLVQDGRSYGERVGSPALTSQACFIKRFKPISTESPGVRTFYVQAADAPERDPLIDTGPAILKWRATFPDLVELTVQGRKGTWHVPLIERPADAAEVVMLVRGYG